MSDFTKEKIGIVIPLLREGGGAEKIASWLSSQFSVEKDVTVFTFWKRENEHNISGERINLEFNSKISFFNGIKRAFKIKEICQKKDITKIISFTEEANFVCLLSKIFGCKGKLFLAVRNNPEVRGFLSRLFIRLFYKMADMVIANSRKMSLILEKKFGLKKVHVVLNPCDIDLNKKKSLEMIPGEIESKILGKFVFINSGRLINQKGYEYLLNSFKKVIGVFPNSILLILGGGVEENKLLELSKKLGLSKDVLFLGIKKNVYPFLRRADCFVFSSIWEGFPNSLIDALSIGKTVISTDCDTGPRELLSPEISILEKINYPHFGEFGVLVEVPSQTNDSFSNIMIEAIKTKCWNNKYKNCDRAIEKLDPRKVFSEWRELLS